ncbi:hypothetical protein O181_112495, partial [Austropuccinia psidii MF-1]|nr:hypothetical protein [Austropuccinia psidii MF-1]
IPSNPQTNSNFSDTPKTLNNLELSPNDQRENNKNQNVTTNTLWQYKANFSQAIVSDPKSYSQATHHPDSKQWLAAIDNELSNMKKHQVWSPHEQDKSIHLLTTTWVFKREKNTDGNLTKYKARLCVRGFNQQEGIDYNDVFSLTGRLASLRLLLRLAHQHGFQIDQMDLKCAFLMEFPTKRYTSFALMAARKN